MDKKTVNLIFSIAMMVLGCLSILLGLLEASLPHSLRIAAAILQIVVGAIVVWTSVLKLRGKF